MTIKENIYSRTDGWLKTRRISTGYDQVTISDGTFQSGGTSIMAVDKVSCRLTEIGQYFHTLGRWQWMLLRVNKNFRTRIVTAYCPMVSAITGGTYSQQ